MSPSNIITYSIVIPVYNVNPAFLDQCINSILTQSFSDFEIILVDDGSTDTSGQLCDEFAAKDNRISVIHKQNGGVSSARNEGISAAKGEWLLFCDADDTLQENCLELVFQTISVKNYDLYKFHYRILKRNGSYQEVPNELESKVYSAEEYLKLLLRHKIVGSCWGYVYRTKYVKQIKFNNVLNIGEDTLFVINYLLIIQDNIFVSPSVMYNYRDNPQSVSKDWGKICSEIDTVNDEIRLLLNHFSALEKYRTEYNTYVVHNLFCTHLWKHRIPNRKNQQFLIAYGNNCCEGDIDLAMKRYVHYLKINRIVGNAYLNTYYYRTTLFTSVVALCRLFFHIHNKR